MPDVSRGPQRRNDPHHHRSRHWRTCRQIGESVGMAVTLDTLPDDAETLKAMILAARAESARLDVERRRLLHESQVLAAEVDRLTARNERLDHIVSVLRRAQFGRRSERIGDEQIELALEDVETQHGAEDAAAEAAEPIVKAEGAKAIDASAAARGGVLSGGALKAMQRYGQDFAANEYGAAYNRFNNDQTTRFNRLSAIAGTGQQATNAGIDAGNTYQTQRQNGVNNITIANQNAADATSSAYAGAGRAISGAANNIGGYFALKDLYKSSPQIPYNFTGF